MPRVLITGGNGFLGSNLVRFFLKRGYSISVISRSCSNLGDLLESIHFIKHSSPGYAQFSEEIRSFNPTVVIHCAWDGGSTYNDVNNIKQFQNIVHGTELLDCIDSAAFIGFGSFSEYGRITTPVSESTPDSPMTLYGQSKSSFKTISKMICEQRGLRWSWIRPCLIYGANDVPTRLFPSTIRKLIAGQPVVLDSCKDVVDYLHVDDFCTGMDMVITASISGIVNFCSGNEYSVRSLIEKIRDEFEYASVTFDPARDRKHLSSYVVGDPWVLRSLGWKPTVDIYTGLKNLIIDQKVPSVTCDLDGLHPT
jgi:dTDP-glucose 4,6-dehydratase